MLAVITAALLLGAVTYTVVVEPQLSHRIAGRQKLRKLQLKLARMERDLLEKDRIEAAYSTVKPLIAASGSDQKEISLFTSQLSNLYSNLELKIRSVKVLPVNEKKFYRRLSMKIELSGPVRNILRFIYLIETYQKPLRIEKLDLRARDVAGSISASLLITKVVAKNTGDKSDE